MSKKEKYSLATGVEEMAKKIIEKHHGHLRDAKIKYLFIITDWTKKGKIVLGQAKLAAEDVRFISKFDFIIIINSLAWYNADTSVREALIDHELHHCEIEEDEKGNLKFSILDHDVQEFIPIVSRYGLRQEDLQRLVAASQSNKDRKENIHGA